MDDKFYIIFIISSLSTSTIFSCGTFFITSPFLNNSPSFIPPAMPISASFASPGPFTPTSHNSYCYI